MGSSVVNALSTYLHVTVKTGGQIYEDHYERGIPTLELADGLLPVVGKPRIREGRNQKRSSTMSRRALWALSKT